MPLLIIEDNKDLVQVLSEGFAENGFSVDSAFSGEEGLEKISRGSYGCIILDIMLPGIDGLQVLDTVRAQGNETPVLLLTARDTVEDRVDGLNRGADDYLSKPFDFRELVARINALLRRTADRHHSVLRCGSLELDPVSRECRIGGKPLSLRRREFDILELLLRNENQVFTRENLISSVWRKEYSGSSNVVDVHVKYLRDKLRPFGCDTLVVTVRGVGYKMNCPEYS
ncbi:Response regulator ArlR [bioreactor metagenome]|uniref:Response regulator ArlR n=1 Tax=bioreactor metagenome TaxID=1076179 RepID=A0A644W943_9ZZZZ|nr:response regulator transcription factor [Aminivibrio sp.]MDD3515920.1 response regulator transcription factor [Synergistaceae bacterium]MEA4951664.1 response regulator transcription factor [Aminivibrio sp.]HPF84457.1 response regulator transcription factor [Aminivibrio sp.]HPK06456.1 response regulator transcription factor [Aminivibrio sp.]HRX25275.1 response regulator transcription factor [Aminivibrio sp.]